jgi:hypothetical protein
MPITNTWTVTQLDCYPQQGDNANIVFTIHWTLDATDGTYTGRAHGFASVAYEEDTPFTPYDELTEEQVISWTIDALGQERVADLEAEVARQVQIQADPPSVAPPLPWG